MLLRCAQSDSANLMDRLVHFHDSRGLDDRRFLLPLGELLRAVAINVDASKLFTVRVIHGNLPVMVPTPLVATHAAGLLELGFFHDEWGPPHEGLWQVYEGRASNKLGVNAPIPSWHAAAQSLEDIAT